MKNRRLLNLKSALAFRREMDGLERLRILRKKIYLTFLARKRTLHA